MCAIIGALLVRENVQNLHHIFYQSTERGRDGMGWYTHENGKTVGGIPRLTSGPLIANLRAEPTTEYVKHKAHFDQQPYRLGQWCVVHNGTIANDKDVRTNEYQTTIDSAAIIELLVNQPGDPDEAFVDTINKLKGSYAILAVHDQYPEYIYAACNYRPIWYVVTDDGVYFASSRDYLPRDVNSPTMLPPYSIFRFSATGAIKRLDYKPRLNKKALVVCSGGLDSTVAAKLAIDNDFEIELLHFLYGSRAQGPETHAIQEIGKRLNVPVRLFPIPIYKPEDSPLLRADSKIAGGEAGAEFAHEWVPARNLVMLAVATAVAEAGGFNTIVLGNNLEEAGAYPDNEPEFIHRFNDMLPFAVGDGKHVEVVMPVGNMMKHEIVKLGLDIEAPLDLTWSCYRAGEIHCGTCGPCYMRRKAFEINGAEEVIKYIAEEVTS